MKTAMSTLILMSMVLASNAFGAEKTKSVVKKTTEVSAEQRQNMAAAHEKMAACLRSDKPMDDCMKEMMDKGACPMMGQMHGKMGKGMMHDHEKSEGK